MNTRIDEISDGIFRVALFPTNGFISFNQFIIRGERPALIHTGHAKTFGVLREQVEKLIDPKTLEVIAFSHFEPDECGALNEWLALAPRAEVYAGKICHSSLTDFASRPSTSLRGAKVLELGSHELEILETPHFPHNWDACLFYEKRTGTLFSSDVGTHAGDREAVTNDDRSDEIMALQERLGYMPKGPHMQVALQKLRERDIRTMAVMHGSALGPAATAQLLAALERDNSLSLR